MHSYIFILLCAIFPMCLTIQMLPERSPTGVQKGRGSTEINIVKFEYEWTIKNISLFCTGERNRNEYIKSPTFSMVTSTDTYIWSLQLKVESNNYIQIDLNLESGSSSEIHTTFRVYGLDEYLIKIDIGNIYDSNERIIWPDSCKGIGPLDNVIAANLVEDDTLTILLEGESAVATNKLDGDTLNRYKFLDQNTNLPLDTLVEADLDREMLEEILHFMYTKQPSNWMKMQEGIFWAGDKFGLKLLFEEQLMSKLNIENAADIYKFTYMHGQTDLKHVTMEFIKKNGAAVMASKGWLSMLESADTRMLVEIFSAFVNKQPIKNSSNSSKSAEVLIATEHTPKGRLIDYY